MGADNWGKCPQCIKLHNEEVKADHEALMAAYGDIDAGEFARIMRELDIKTNNGVMSNTLRENYELHMSADGVFTIDYRASCKTCGFSYKYNESEEAL